MLIHQTLRHRPGRPAGALLFSALLALPAVCAAEDPAKSAAERGRDAARDAAEQVDAYREESTELNEAQVKAALAQLDAEIEQLEALADDAPNDARREAVLVRIDALKERRDDLRGEFNAARFAELKTDVRREWNEFKAWVADQTDGVEEEAEATADADRDRERRGVHDTSNYVRTPEAAGAPVAVARDSDYGKDRARQDGREVALERVDRELDRLERRAERLAEADREQFEERVSALRDRRDQLDEDFSDERYTALMKDILSEERRIRSAAE